ncbi:hypothetical protein LCGC14_2117660 [marine sediment metagenome]|uniref:Uncharacterized protein n=1 Tax=marine sediment metagenome TaxID=412755 RepID=A0A0F9E577_9ZZZZ
MSAQACYIYPWEQHIWPRPLRATPHYPQPPLALCPVCKGRGKVPAEFYDGTGTSIVPELCRSCWGAGYIQTSAPYHPPLTWGETWCVTGQPSTPNLGCAIGAPSITSGSAVG